MRGFLNVPKKDTSHPDYYHKVVDCQWACPAHTNVPEYIRLIAQKRFDDAYMLNRESNVFPGILGRICDRPCEPACRRGRVDEKPVAICRLKRAAADLRGDITARLPAIPVQKNGKRVALIGAGPASLTVANDLAPLGYECVIFEKQVKLGGAMRASVPGFRLPEDVLDEEIAYITERGVEVRAGAAVTSLKGLLADRFDAVFVGSGAPLGRDLKIPGRDDVGQHVHVGLDWLAGVAFDHIQKISPRVLVIGGGNTAMDCCRTARRLGGTDVTVVAPEGFHEMLASPWEKDDAVEEGIPIRNNLLPKSFVVENGKFKGVLFEPLKQCYDADRRWNPIPSGESPVLISCDEVILAIGQDTAFPFIERDLMQFDERNRPVVNTTTFRSTHPQVFFGGDAAFGPKNIIWAVAHGHEAAVSIHLSLNGQDLMYDRPENGMNLISQKMGLHEWSYKNDYSGLNRQAVPHIDLKSRFEDLHKEVELGFDLKLAMQEAQRCLNCDVQTVFTEKLCIECDSCVDICPLDCLTMTTDGTDQEIAAHMTAPRLSLDQPLYVSGALPSTGRVMVKDENLCVHCGLCAERCPTGAWDMQKFILQRPHAGG